MKLQIKTAALIIFKIKKTGVLGPDLITTDSFLFQLLKLPLQLRLTLHFLLSSPHEHGLPVELGAVHFLHSLVIKTHLSENISTKRVRLPLEHGRKSKRPC